MPKFKLYQNALLQQLKFLTARKGKTEREKTEKFDKREIDREREREKREALSIEPAIKEVHKDVECL